MQLKDKVVLVTGAANGTGKVIAQKFLEEGAIVVAADVRELEWEAGVYEDKVFKYVFDVSDEEAVNKAINEVNEKTNGISILVNNDSIPLKRFQAPEDIAAMAIFLASDNGKNVNGESINLDGGVVRC